MDEKLRDPPVKENITYEKMVEEVDEPSKEILSPEERKRIVM